jgi:hypothetical protein
MKMLAWLVVACLGFGLMAWSYFGYQRVDETVPWARGAIYLSRPGLREGKPARDLDAISARARLLPLEAMGEAILQSLSKSGRPMDAVEAQLRGTLIAVAPRELGIADNLLQRGRLPVAGRDEVLAGYDAGQKNELTVSGRRLTVVGVLPRDAAVLAGAYILPPSALSEGLFDKSDTGVRDAVLLRLTPQQSRDRQLAERLSVADHDKRFAAIHPAVRVDCAPYYLNLAGEALLLLGGSGGFIGLFTALAQRVRWRVLSAPLLELSRRRRLLWAVHVCYFGLVMIAAAAIYGAPQVQKTLLTVIHDELASGTGPLGIAGTAYATKNIALAAAVTLAVNFLVGSLLYITFPSMVIPGIGALAAAFRAIMWGLLLAPTTSLLGFAMLPHSWTILIEGEGYILATFFALMIPTYLARTGMGSGFFQRYGRGLLVNAQGALLTLIVLAVAACYEATEVITMMNLAGR